MTHRAFIVLMLTGLLIATAITPTFAQQVPNVTSLTPFSTEANFMSLPGYLRWLVFQQTGNWITRQEAVRMVQEQLAAAGR